MILGDNERENDDNIDTIIKSLTRKDLLLLSSYIDSQSKTIRDIHNIYNDKLERRDRLGEDITRHRLRYLELIGLLKSVSKNGKLTFMCKFEDDKLVDRLMPLNLQITKDEKLKRRTESEIVEREESEIVDTDDTDVTFETHNEAVEKLNMLLEENDIPKKGWQYLIKKK